MSIRIGEEPMHKQHRNRVQVSGSADRKLKIENRRLVRIFALAIVFTMSGTVAHTQTPKVERIGVVTAGGAWYQVIDGLRVGLKQLGLTEGKHFALEIRDTKGNAAAAEDAAKSLERERVSLLYTTQTSVTLATKRATADTPIIFCAGADPVELGLVTSFAKPSGRLTGVFVRDTDHCEASSNSERDRLKASARRNIL